VCTELNGKAMRRRWILTLDDTNRVKTAYDSSQRNANAKTMPEGPPVCVANGITASPGTRPIAKISDEDPQSSTSSAKDKSVSQESASHYA
jgi:hypothetical protein